MSAPPVLAYDESSLPGTTQRERLELAKELGLALEARHDAAFDAEDYARDELAVVTLQAWRLHREHPLHSDHAKRARAVEHIEAALRAAHAAGIPRILTTSGFGFELCDEPRERALEAFRQVAPLARELGVRVAIELLGPRRVGALATPEEHSALLDDLRQPDVFGAAFDTGHLVDGGYDPREVVAACAHPVDQVQLRGPRSTLPRNVDLAVLELLRRVDVAVVSCEHAERVVGDAVRVLVAEVRGRAVFGGG